MLASLVLVQAPRYYTPPPDENMLKNMCRVDQDARHQLKKFQTSAAKHISIVGSNPLRTVDTPNGRHESFWIWPRSVAAMGALDASRRAASSSVRRRRGGKGGESGQRRRLNISKRRTGEGHVSSQFSYSTPRGTVAGGELPTYD